MKRLLLFGAQGQIGWEVRRRASKAGWSCYTPSREELDITQRGVVLAIVDRLQPSLVINAAAYTMVDRAESEAKIAFSVNRDGAEYVAQSCAATRIPLIHISTDYVFDGHKRCPYKENDPVAPLNVYGESKLAGEEAIRRACAEHIILRTAWVYGIHGSNFVKTMLRLGRERDILTIVDDQFGSPTFAGDLANSIITLVERIKSPRGSESFGTFNCAGQGSTTWFRFARTIFEMAEPLWDRRIKVEPIKTSDYKTPAKRPGYSVLDCSRLATVHGIVMRPWQTALAEALEPLLIDVESTL